MPQIARSLLVRFGLLYVNANVNAYGTEVSATNGVGNKIQKFSFYQPKEVCEARCEYES
ncbi:MAG: hypothetical protein LIO78_02360 [Clostridiales bacterium]|nr:hypothetical protein [Clostridiales bacterium]